MNLQRIRVLSCITLSMTERCHFVQYQVTIIDMLTVYYVRKTGTCHRRVSLGVCPTASIDEILLMINCVVFKPQSTPATRQNV